MRLSPSSLLGISLLSVLISLSSVASATSHDSQPQHNKLIKIKTSLSAGLEKRYDNARLTWYDITTGEVACGGWHKSSDHVVALNDQQWDGGAHCGKQIAITVNGKTVNAWIVDECPGCPWAALDLTKGLFQEFGDLDTGVLWGSWDYV